jgi:zinc-binding alcohol dehydrogenase family protein
MKAIAAAAAGPLSQQNALVEIEVERPEPGPHDLLVKVRGISVNPVDLKLRARIPAGGTPRILGFDAAGTVIAVGEEVTRFRPGDEVFYAGDVTRPGTNAEFHLVEESIVGRKPSRLDFADAAALPLTSITAWELLFDSLGLREGDGAGEELLVVGGAGGVGSILIQLARRLTGLTVIASASRPETRAWVERMGAHHVIDHRNPLDEQVQALGIQPRYVASLTHTQQHFASIVELIRPRGRIALIDDPQELDGLTLKRKSLALCWEFMFARPMFRMEDREVQHRLLNRVADLLDQGALHSTVTQRGGALNVANLRRAHERQATGRAIGKTVLDGFGAVGSSG